MSIDTISDFLTIIRNGLRASKRQVFAPYSNEKFGIAKVLKDEGYIRGFYKVEEKGQPPRIKVLLKYVDGQPAIHDITRISVPSRRRYESCEQMTEVIGGLGVAILTTNRGIITNKQAKTLNVGGEVICHVW